MAQATPLAAGLGVAAAALVSRELVKQYVKFKAAPAAARAFYKVCSGCDMVMAGRYSFMADSLHVQIFCLLEQ